MNGRRLSRLTAFRLTILSSALIGLLVIFTLERDLRGLKRTAADELSSAVLQPPCPGDTNLDGERDVFDVVSLLRHLLSIAPLTGTGLLNGDANLDGTVDLSDPVAILQSQVERFQLASCSAFNPSGDPHIRFIAPKQGPGGTPFTLVGRNFDPNPAGNTVRFLTWNQEYTAVITEASSNHLAGIVPPGIPFPGPGVPPPEGENEAYEPLLVSVTVGEKKSNQVSFRGKANPPPLTFWPPVAVLLTPPGSGSETLVVGGGKPPYSLRPPTPEEDAIFDVTLQGSVVRVTGGPAGQTLVLEVQDSSKTPLKTRASVVSRPPYLNAEFTANPHSLIAHSAPGFSLFLSFSDGSMRIREITLAFENARLRLAGLETGQQLGFVTVKRYSTVAGYQLIEVTEMDDESAKFEIVQILENTRIVQGNGVIYPGSVNMRIWQSPESNPESVFDGRLNLDFLLSSGVIEMPEPGEEMTVRATLTSVSVRDEADLPLRTEFTQSFTATGPEGPVVLEDIQPVRTGISYKVTLEGSGFSANPTDNEVTFSGFQATRPRAEVLEAAGDRLVVAVPETAISGPVRVAVNGEESNAYPIWILFHATAGVYFEQFQGAVPTAPLIRIEQPAFYEYGCCEGDEILVGSALLSIEGSLSNLSALGLIQGQAVGSAQLINRQDNSVFEKPITYMGREEVEPFRHWFEVKWLAQIYLDESSSPGALDFEILPLSDLRPDQDWSFRFDAPIYLPPAGPKAPVSVIGLVTSKAWNAIPGTELETVRRFALETE